MPNVKRRAVIRCAECGEDQDLSYIEWDRRVLCASCFGKAIGDYARKYPFLLAGELQLNMLHIPEEGP